MYKIMRKTWSRKTEFHKTQINTNKFLREGQSIEEVMRINTANKVQPETILPEIYQKRSEGVDPLCDIRTDKWELAIDAQDKITRAHMLASQNKDKMGKPDNTWIVDEDGNPMYENPNEGKD